MGTEPALCGTRGLRPEMGRDWLRPRSCDQGYAAGAPKPPTTAHAHGGELTKVSHAWMRGQPHRPAFWRARAWSVGEKGK